MISPPLIPISRILDVVFPPPPPIPITLILADCFCRICSSSRSISAFALVENDWVGIASGMLLLSMSSMS